MSHGFLHDFSGFLSQRRKALINRNRQHHSSLGQGLCLHPHHRCIQVGACFFHPTLHRGAQLRLEPRNVLRQLSLGCCEQPLLGFFIRACLGCRVTLAYLIHSVRHSVLPIQSSWDERESLHQVALIRAGVQHEHSTGLHGPEAFVKRAPLP